MHPILTLQNISKTFGPVQALKNVSMEVYPGEVHAVIGENGAGKSTLMKILSGALQPDPGGTIHLHQNPYRPANPAAGRKAGIAMIYQELNLAPHLTIEENIMLGLEVTNWGFLQDQSLKVKKVLAWLEHEDLAPSTKVGKLSIGYQQLVEIARALASEAKVIIMDEPTSSLSAEDSQVLFKIVRRLRAKGIAIVYISHFLEEVKEVGDRFTVLRDGEEVASGQVAQATLEQMITAMVGRSVNELYPGIPHGIGTILAAFKQLSAATVPQGVSFSIRRGEILGLAGLVGAGRSETVRSVFGLKTLKDGSIQLAGHPQLKVRHITPNKALQLGMDLLSENRKEEGLALNMALSANITLSALKKYSKWGLLRLKEETRAAREFIRQLQLRSQNAQQLVSQLSGGNQQKVCFARLLHHDSDLFFLDEPTRGIDVGSKVEIYRIIQQLAAKGKSIVLISSYLPELFGVCDTLAVMHRGKISAIKPIKQWNTNEVMHFATTGKV